MRGCRLGSSRLRRSRSWGVFCPNSCALLRRPSLSSICFRTLAKMWYASLFGVVMFLSGHQKYLCARARHFPATHILSSLSNRMKRRPKRTPPSFLCLPEFYRLTAPHCSSQRMIIWERVYFFSEVLVSHFPWWPRLSRFFLRIPCPLYWRRSHGRRLSEVPVRRHVVSALQKYQIRHQVATTTALLLSLSCPTWKYY